MHCGSVNRDTSLQIDVHGGVYEPAEDSHLLIQAVEVTGNERALDMGCGCGIVALHLAREGCRVVAADISEHAVENTRMNAEKNGLTIQAITSDLFAEIEGIFDVITFNPPYLPTENEHLAWDGGREGIEVMARFLHEAHGHLSENGRIYMVMSSLGNVEKLMKMFSGNYRFTEVARTSFFFERLYVYLIEPLK